MAIETMESINLVGQLEDFEPIMREIILSEKVELTNAYDQIEESKFTLSMVQDNIHEIVDLSVIKHYEADSDLSELHKQLNEIINILGISKKIDEKAFEEDYDFTEVAETIKKIYSDFSYSREKIQALEAERNELKKMLALEPLIGLDIDFNKLFNLENFDVKLGKLTPENKRRLSMNYDNITATVMHLEMEYKSDLHLVVTPKELSLETERILRSVYFEEIELIDDYLDTPEQMIQRVNKRIDEILEAIDQHFEKMVNFHQLYDEKIKMCYSRLKMQEKIQELSKKIASTEHFFYLSGWIPEEATENFERRINKNKKNIIIDYKEKDYRYKSLKPPTKLNNGWLFKPFEQLVNMYGIPNYNEVDPTIFFGITYMFLFGAMFGDLGQGLVFLFVGIYLSNYKNKPLFGDILSRIGISSMFFGFFYDSFFGYEHIVSHFFPEWLFIRPLDNTNTLLMAAVGLGVILLVISFGFSIYVKNKNDDLKEGVFGRNGVIGLILYLTLLAFVYVQFTGSELINTSILTGIIIITVVLMFFREPLANKLQGKSYLYDHSPGEYYTESIFDVIETFLSLISNSLSFIRVGAFALNHVGLFIAFHTMANIIGNVFGDVSMFILGNLLVIFLEGLIVFIQGLRLVYYEIFSKYYIGDGRAFEPVKLEL